MSQARPVRTLWVAAAAVAGVVLQGCGSSDPITREPSPSPTVEAVHQTVVSQLTGASLQAEWAGVVPFTTPRAGTLDVTVDWTYTANDVDVAIASGSCTIEQLQADQCQFLAFAVSETAKPETLRLANAAAGSYTVVVSNIGPGDESISFQVVLTTTGVGSATRATAVTVPRKRRPRATVELR